MGVANQSNGLKFNIKNYLTVSSVHVPVPLRVVSIRGGGKKPKYNIKIKKIKGGI